MVLDEATSALDEKSQDKMMEIVIQELPKATIVSVAHRVELEAFHSRKIVLERRKGGAKLVSDIDADPAQGQTHACSAASCAIARRRRRRRSILLIILRRHRPRRRTIQYPRDGID